MQIKSHQFIVIKGVIPYIFFLFFINIGYSFQKDISSYSNDNIEWIKNSKSIDSIRDLIYNTMTEDVSLAVTYAEVFLEKVKTKRKDNSIQYLAYYDLGVALYQNSEYSKAISQVDAALIVIPEGERKKTRLLSAYLLKGSAYNDNRQYKEALETFLLGEKIIQNDTSLIHYKLSFLNNIGIIRIEIEEFDDALITFKEVFKLMESQRGSENFIIENYISVILHLALSYFETGDLKNTTKYNKLGLTLSIDNDLREDEGIFLMNIAEVLIEKGQPDLALEKLYKSKKILNNENSNVNFLLANYYIAKTLYIKNH